MRSKGVVSRWRCVVWVMVAAMSFAAQASEFSVSPTSGITYQSSERDVKLNIGARLNIDGAIFGEDKSRLDNDVIIRRARLSLQMDLFKDWRVSAQYDVVDERDRFRTLWLRYTGFHDRHITIGQFREPFSLEEVSSSNNTIFMERSLANALTPGTSVGLSQQRWGDRWSAEAGLFWGSGIEQEDVLFAKQGHGLAGRVSIAPQVGKQDVLHLGLSAAYRTPDESKSLTLSSQPETEVTERSLISTGRLRNVDSEMMTGLEAATTRGPLLLQGEYIQTWVFRSGDRQNERFDGGYLAASWLLNGVQRNYSSREGVFGKVKPGKDGVWELALRRSYLDLNSRIGSVTGGRQFNTTWAINWYANENVRVMLNYIRVDTDAEAGNDDPSILQMRLQWVI